jgi:hypothetical protein
MSNRLADASLFPIHPQRPCTNPLKRAIKIEELSLKEENQVAKEKQHMFSARFTEAGLELLNELKDRLGIGWDELVIDGISAHYELDRAMMTLPKKEAPAKVEAKGSEPTESKEEKPAVEVKAKEPLQKPTKKPKVAAPGEGGERDWLPD